jgi:ankyrin repeat protein
VHHGRVDVARILLIWNADPELPGDVTPLWDAVRRGNVEMVKLFLLHGADPNARCWAYGEDSDSTPLSVAVRAKAGLDLLQLLLHYGGDPFMVNCAGVAPYDLADGVGVPDLLCSFNEMRCGEYVRQRARVGA